LPDGRRENGTCGPARRRGSVVCADRDLPGARASDLPVEQPTKIDLKTAKILDLTVPPALRPRADRLLE
jgi:putative ABC transport system substrate-binding protein